MNEDPQALAAVETYLVRVLETSDPPRDASEFNVTAAAHDYHASTGSWQIQDADPATVEALLVRHAR